MLELPLRGAPRARVVVASFEPEPSWGDLGGDDMTRPYSVALKQKMIQRLTGKNAVSAVQLSRETGVRQQNLSRWLEQARSLPFVTDKPKPVVPDNWTVERKAKLLADAANLTGKELAAHLERSAVKLGDYERWRLALEQGGRAADSTTKRIRSLERELARKEKALAEAAALLVLKKKCRACTWKTRTTIRNGDTVPWRSKCDTCFTSRSWLRITEIPSIASSWLRLSSTGFGLSPRIGSSRRIPSSSCGRGSGQL